MPLSAFIEQHICPACDPWRAHLVLLLIVLLVGVLTGLCIASFIANAGAARRAGDALERREADYSKSSNGSLSAEQRARIAFELSCDGEPRPVPPVALDGRPLIEKRAPRGRRGS